MDLIGMTLIAVIGAAWYGLTKVNKNAREFNEWFASLGDDED